jgi:cytochrome c oxidase assembly protein subunit 15
MFNYLRRSILSAVALTFIVIILGAYTRLKDAGLGCPDWPGCYGHLLAPTQDTKAWIEMVHRYIAGTLGILILFITLQSIYLRSKIKKLWWLTTAISALVVMQALLGMWTVTLKLYPIVVMAHLLGGFCILALLWLSYLHLVIQKQKIMGRDSKYLIAVFSLIALIIQIALGGWTSANYAALVCADFPTCQGYWWPAMDWHNAFNLTQVGIFESPGTPLENSARVTIQMAHRIGALLTTVLLAILSYKLLLSTAKILKQLGIILLALLSVQIILGITNVLGALPLSISLAHNATAALLLISLLTIFYASKRFE